MSIDIQPKYTNFNIEAVQAIVADGVVMIAKSMTQALMEALQAKLDFSSLCKKHINPKLQEEVNALDNKTARVYRKLILATFEFIQNNSPPLKKTLEVIGDQVNSESPALFLGSFVLPASQSMVEKLKAEQPESLENEAIWN